MKLDETCMIEKSEDIVESSLRIPIGETTGRQSIWHKFGKSVLITQTADKS